VRGRGRGVEVDLADVIEALSLGALAGYCLGPRIFAEQRYFEKTGNVVVYRRPGL